MQAHQLHRLERTAREAVEQYNKDLTAGGEPFFPDWAIDLMSLLEEHRAISEVARICKMAREAST